MFKAKIIPNFFFSTIFPEGEVRLIHFLGRALQLGQDRGSRLGQYTGRGPRLGHARGPGAVATVIL